MQHHDPSGDPAAGMAAPANADPATVLSDTQALHVLAAELKASKDEQLRLLAEMDNLRKRAARDAEAARKFGTERLLGDLLPVCDALEAGLKSDSHDPATLRQGMELTWRLLTKALESNGLASVDPVGQAFDPEQHQAMTLVESEQHAPGAVVTVFQRGYRLNERLLRPALVAVAKDRNG
jgi:molecular chaperone GrpE